MADLIPGLPYEKFRAAGLAAETEAEFRASRFFAEWGEALLQFLGQPTIHPAAAPNSLPSMHPANTSSTSAPPVFRLVQWNIEKGVQLERILRRLTEDPHLAGADAYCLNEVDFGMARSGENADVAEKIASALGCSWTFLPSFLECTKGPESDALAPGENARGIHGLAILSRHPILEAESEPLPSCWDYFDFFEKRFGFRQALYARINWSGQEIVVATTHLEVRNTPACRAAQFRVFLDGLRERQKRWGEIPAILSGDFNSHTFRRGGLVNSVREFIRIIRTAPETLDSQLLEPWSHEVLFRHLDSAGFQYRDLTDGQPTIASTLGTEEDLAILPTPIRRYVEQRYGFGTRELLMRLDWIATEGLTTEAASTHSASVDGLPASDHDLLTADVSLDEPAEKRLQRA